MVPARQLTRRFSMLVICVLSGLWILATVLGNLQTAHADSIPLAGVGAVDIVYNPVDGYLYTLNSNNSVSVVDGNRIITTIDLPSGSFGRLTDIAVHEGNGDVYISQWFYDQVIVLRNQAIYGIVPRQNDYQNPPGPNGIENGPVVVAYNPVNDMVYVATGWTNEPEQNGVTVLDGLSVITHVQTGGFPQAIGIFTDTGAVYVANALSNNVTVINAANEIITHIDVGDYPVALFMDPDNDRVYVANREGGSVSIINRNTNSVIGTVPSGQGTIRLTMASPESGMVYAVNRDDDTVTVIDSVTMTYTDVITVGDSPIAILGHAPSGLVYVANQMDGTVSVLQGDQLIETIDVGVSPIALVNKPPNEMVVVNFQDATLSLLQGTALASTIEGLPRLSHTSMSQLPDGHVVVADLTGRKTWFLDESEVVTTVNLPTQDGFPLLLWETPGRIPVYDYLQVSHESIAVDETGRVFIANHGESSVSLLTEASGHLQPHEWVRQTPFDIAWMPGDAPSNGRLYTTVGAGVSVLQGNPTITQTTYMSNSAFLGARAVAVWPEMDRVYIVRSPSSASTPVPGKVTILDDATLEILHNFDICSVPAAIDIDRQRGFVYVTCSGSNSVAVISGTSWIEIPVGYFPQDVQINPVNRYAYVVSLLSDHVAVLDGQTLLAMIPVPPFPIAIDIDSQGWVYVASEVGQAVSVISGTSLLTTIPVGKHPDELLADENTGVVYVSNAHDSRVDIFGLEQLSADAGNTWQEPVTITEGVAYVTTIQDTEDVDWYKIPVSVTGSNLTATLGGLAADYELAVFRPLTTTGFPSSTVDSLDLSPLSANGSLVNLGQLLSLPFRGGPIDLPFRGGPTDLSSNSFLQPEIVADTIWESGYYYVAVWGYNGAHSSQPYSLRVEVSPPATPVSPVLPIPPLPNQLPPPDLQVRSVFLVHTAQMRAMFGLTRTYNLTSELEAFAALPEIGGEVIDLSDPQYLDIAAAYSQWMDAPYSVQAANYTADVIKYFLQALLEVSYPEAAYIVVVGDDNAIPFYRIPDTTLISNERTYLSHASVVNDNTPMEARLLGGYILSDNYYASFHPLTAQGRQLFIPELAIGRLVETPEEIINTLTAFSNTQAVTLSTSLVTGYDFVTDGSTMIQDELVAGGSAVTSLISDDWTADDLRPLLLTNTYDFVSLNGHFDHQQLVAANLASVIEAAEIATASTDFDQDILISIGCQSGLSISDHDALGGVITDTYDFPQAFANRGAAYIANTGFGYGDSDAIGYSEELALQLVRALSQVDGMPIGQALMEAKQAYYVDAGFSSFSEYDEKVLVEWTLYGLPMIEVHLPANLSLPRQEGQLDGVSLPVPVGLMTPTTLQQVVTIPVSVLSTFTPVTVTTGNQGPTGTYLDVTATVQIGNELPITITGDLEVNPGRPLQPRLTLSITATNTQYVAHGVIFDSGHYDDNVNFDPVVSRIVSDTSQSEPLFGFPQWYPMPMHMVNRLRLGDRYAAEKLIFSPAQYLAQTSVTGTARLYDGLQFQVLYASVSITDFFPPTIQQVQVITSIQGISFTVAVTDMSGLDQVLVTYDNGQGDWQSTALSNSYPGVWQGIIHPTNMKQAFIQAVDSAGNVSISANKGYYFTAVNVQLEPDAAGSGLPGQLVTYTHTLTNAGGGADTFLLSAASSGNWPVQVQPAAVSLASQASATIIVTVTVPLGALHNDTDTLTILVQSLTNQGVTAVVQDTTTVLQAGGVLLTADHNNSGIPGETITYTHTVRNSGNGSDIVSVSVYQGVLVSPSEIPLLVGEVDTITVQVTVPPTAISGTQLATLVTVTSGVDPDVMATNTNTMTVNQVTGLALSDAYTGQALPGSSLAFTHLLTNTGNFTESVIITAVSVSGWPLVVPDTAVVGPYAHAVIPFTVTIPVNVPLGTSDTLILQATSAASAQIFAIVTDTLVVEQYAELQISPAILLPAEAGSVVTFTHTLTNEGNGLDTFLVSVTNGTLNSPDEITLAAGMTGSIIFTIQVSAGTMNGTVLSASLTVTSDFDPLISEMVIDTVAVYQVGHAVFLPLVVRPQVAALFGDFDWHFSRRH